MQLGLIGLGRMGANMVTRLTSAGHDLHVYDRDRQVLHEIEAKGAKTSASLEAFARELQKRALSRRGSRLRRL